MIELTFIDNLTDIIPFKEQMWELIKLSDKDYFPSLSSRENSNNGPVKYFKGLFTDSSKFVLASIENKIVGFSVFFNNYYEDLISPYTPCNYVKLACIHPSYRGLRIGSTLNKFIEEQIPEDLKLPYIVRRTWSTNTPQIKLLQRFGYNLIHKIEGDRGFGISTVFFAKHLVNHIQINIALQHLPLQKQA